jgi:ribosome-associated toxin RatA of RatAB toxin-antitoxin module
VKLILVNMSKSHATQSWASLPLVAISILTIFQIPAQAQLFNSPIDRLPVQTRVDLRDGKVVIDGENGKYVAKILVTAPTTVVWSVLTDFQNFPKFLPNVVSSQIIATKGDSQIVEQIDSRQVLFVNKRSRVRTENILAENQRIDFNLIDGDLEQLQGYWLLEAVATYSGAKPTQILITQNITARPKSGIPKGLFNQIFKDSIRENLMAIGKEVERRSQ